MLPRLCNTQCHDLRLSFTHIVTESLDYTVYLTRKLGRRLSKLGGGIYVPFEDRFPALGVIGSGRIAICPNNKLEGPACRVRGATMDDPL